MPQDNPLRGVQYTMLMNTWGAGGSLINRPGSSRIYQIRFVSYTAASAVAALYDQTNGPANPWAVVNAGGGLPDINPRQPIILPVRRGLYVSFSMGTGVSAVEVAWDRA